MYLVPFPFLQHVVAQPKDPHQTEGAMLPGPPAAVVGHTLQSTQPQIIATQNR